MTKIWYYLYVTSKKWDKWTNFQNRNGITNIENKLMATRWKGGKRGKLGDWDWDIYTNIHKMDN